MHLRLSGKIRAKVSLVVISVLIELQVVLCWFCFDLYASRLYCDHYGTLVLTHTQRAKQCILLEFTVLLIVFLCGWPS